MMDGKAMPDIKKCPFCYSGKNNITEIISLLWVVNCDSCGCVGPFKESKHEAVECWNKALRTE